nr:RNA-directed DNA polymerase, eukaryota [Tanacetum cinerariifolium]
MELEESKNDCFARKRICIKTKQEYNILHKFKIIVHGKIFVHRAKELFFWSLMFKDNTEVAFSTDDESLKEDDELRVDSNNHVDSDAKSDVEGVSDTVFGDQDDKPGQEQAPIQSPKDNELSSDPFYLYDLLNKQDKGETNFGLGSSIPFPPIFTPERINTRNDAQEDIVSDHDKSKCRFDGFSSRIIKGDQPLNEHLSSESPYVRHGYKKGGFVLEVLDDMIKIGQTIGFFMEGCKKDIENIIGLLGDQNETKMDGISDMDVKLLWGNYKFDCWNGECMVMGNYNEVRYLEELMGLVFNVQGANVFNNFILNSRLVEIQLEGFSFTWSHSSATKMSKLDRFLVSEGLVSLFPHLLGICLDRHLLDHKPILLQEVVSDYGPTPFRVFHSWFSLQGFDQMVTQTWNDIDLDDKNGMVHFKKKFQILKKEIRSWVHAHKLNQSSHLTELRSKLSDIDKVLDQGGVTDDILLSRLDLMKQLQDIKSSDGRDYLQKAKINLIGSLYKVVAKVLATRLSSIIPALILGVQTAFLPNRQILDGPFIINELLSWCKHKKQQAMMFKIDFAKAYDSIRWDYLDDVLRAFGFGSKWCSWISGCLHSGMALVLLNGSPTSEFQFQCGLKQRDPLALHLSFSRAVDEGIFKGIQIGSSFNISHLFYADDAIFIGEWSTANLSGITRILYCFSLLSGLKINLIKSQILGIGISNDIVAAAALTLGCSVLKNPFKYLEVMVGGNNSTTQAWDDTINKLKARLSNWKLKTLSVGGRLTLLKSVLGSSPIYTMSIYKVPKLVLHLMESIRRNFFNGVQNNEMKITWVKWSKVLASKKFGGLGVSSLFALNRALLFKWVWRFISRDKSLWCRFITSMHGSTLSCSSPFCFSTWNTIIQEVNMLKDRGADLLSHCHIRVGNGLTTGGVEASQLDHLIKTVEATILTNLEDRWVWDLNGEGVFRVKDARSFLDDCFLPKDPIATRWVKFILIKINMFAWKVFLDRLPTHLNLSTRGIQVPDLLCPICTKSTARMLYQKKAKPFEFGKFVMKDGKVMTLARKSSPSKNCVGYDQPCGALDWCCDPYKCGWYSGWPVYGRCDY